MLLFSAELSICESLATMTSCPYQYEPESRDITHRSNFNEPEPRDCTYPSKINEPELKQIQYRLQFDVTYHLTQQVTNAYNLYKNNNNNNLVIFTSHIVNCFCNLAKG